jgi:hypothetical protein
MRDLLEEIAKALVDNPEDVAVDTGHATDFPVVGKTFNDRIDLVLGIQDPIDKPQKKGARIFSRREIQAVKIQFLLSCVWIHVYVKERL